MIRIKNNLKWIIVCLLGITFFSYIQLTDYYTEKTLKRPVYRVCKLVKIHLISRNANDWLIFKYQLNGEGKQGRIYISDAKYDFYKKKLGKKYLVAMNENQIINKLFLTYFMYDNCPVPDSIKSSPPNGWKELPEWAKKKK